MILAIVVSAVAIFIPSWIFGKWIEGIAFFVCHWLIREQFPQQYHHIVPSVCRLLTGTIFFFGVSFMLPVSASIIFSIPINYFIGWVGYTKKQADYYEHQCEKLKNKYCNEKENLLLLCKRACLNERDTEIAMQYFYEKKAPKEIWLWLCQHKVYSPVEWDSIYVIIHRIGKKIEKVK